MGSAMGAGTGSETNTGSIISSNSLSGIAIVTLTGVGTGSISFNSSS